MPDPIDDIADSMDEDDGFDPILAIIEGAEEFGINVTVDQINEALKQVDLDAEDISLNQPIVDGTPAEHGPYVLFKGGNDEVTGWVTTNQKLASEYGKVSKIVINFNGETIDKWSVVGDWDGNPQLVPPGARLRLVYDDVYLYI